MRIESAAAGPKQKSAASSRKLVKQMALRISATLGYLVVVAKGVKDRGDAGDVYGVRPVAATDPLKFLWSESASAPAAKNSVVVLIHDFSLLCWYWLNLLDSGQGFRWQKLLFNDRRPQHTPPPWLVSRSRHIHQVSEGCR